MLFDYGRRLDEWPDVPQFNIERYQPPRGVPARALALDTPENWARDNAFANRGVELGGDKHLNISQLRSRLVDELGETKGSDAFNKFRNFHAATSLRSPSDQNIRNASYYFHLNQQGLPIPQPRREGSRLILDERVPREYWHPLQPLYALKINQILKHGRLLPLDNPKSASLAENTGGNLNPVQIDTNDMKRERLVDSRGKPLTAPGLGMYGYSEALTQRKAEAFGLPPALYRSAVRFGAAAQTRLRSPLEPLLRTIERRIEVTAETYGMSKEEVFRRWARGEIPLLSLGAATIAGTTSPSQTDESESRENW
jgi:hypothetical protein